MRKMLSLALKSSASFSPEYSGRQVLIVLPFSSRISDYGIFGNSQPL